MRRNKKVFTAMSGGVDSSVAAFLLKNKGYDVVGCFLKGWYPQGISCNWQDDRRDAKRVCLDLNIPFIVIDVEKEYKRYIVDYMIKEYKAGRTPNPDVMCNKHIKFGIFLEQALKQGADYIATGHYVRLKDGRLLQAKDKNKDQSYFLWPLTKDQLKYCLFPIGDFLKSEVRKIAKKNKLFVADKKDSQGVCFIGEFKMKDFLKKYIKPKKGKIMDVNGKVLGQHEGAMFYTIGQRRGFKFAGGVPYYIVDKDIKKNILIVSPKNKEKNRIRITNINWIREKPDPQKEYKARIRYRQPLQKVRINRGVAIFKNPQKAVAFGQSLVVYNNQELLGGGII